MHQGREVSSNLATRGRIVNKAKRIVKILHSKILKYQLLKLFDYINLCVFKRTPVQAHFCHHHTSVTRFSRVLRLLFLLWLGIEPWTQWRITGWVKLKRIRNLNIPFIDHEAPRQDRKTCQKGYKASTFLECL